MERLKSDLREAAHAAIVTLVGVIAFVIVALVLVQVVPR